jgi:hypothetical protein
MQRVHAAGPYVQVVLPFEQVLSPSTVKTAVDAVPGDELVEVLIQPGTRGYGDFCFGGVWKRLAAVRVHASRQESSRMLRRLVVMISMYEPNLIRHIQLLVPRKPGIVGSFAFYGCRSLTSVTIPDTVTVIHECAFNDCSNLTSVLIPDSVTSIGRHAFHGCTGLTSVTIPASVHHVGDHAFHGCSNLRSVRGLGRIELGARAFDGCGDVTFSTDQDTYFKKKK